jgi:hypothetical protein
MNFSYWFGYRITNNVYRLAVKLNILVLNCNSLTKIGGKMIKPFKKNDFIIDATDLYIMMQKDHLPSGKESPIRQTAQVLHNPMPAAHLSVKLIQPSPINRAL